MKNDSFHYCFGLHCGDGCISRHDCSDNGAIYGATMLNICCPAFFFGLEIGFFLCDTLAFLFGCAFCGLTFTLG